MPKILKVHPHLPHADLIKRYQQCQDPAEKARWQAVLLKTEGRRTPDIADVCKRSEEWVRTYIHRYNAQGPQGLVDGRKTNGRPRYLSDSQLEELRKALDNPAEDGGVWNGPKVARWLEKYLRFEHVNNSTGWAYLVRLGGSR